MNKSLRGIVFFLTLLITLPSSQVAIGQPVELRVVGNSVPFIFHSIEQYYSGVELNNWTTIKIKYKNPGFNAWQLVVWTDYSAFDYQDAAPESIDLNKFSLIIDPVTLITNDASATINTPFSPTTSESFLIKGNGLALPDTVSVEFKISYKIESILNKPSGYYYLPLNFLLKEQ